MTTATATRPKSRKRAARKPAAPKGCYGPSRIPSKWARILQDIPGYDPIATAGPGNYFDPTIAQLALDFFPECLTHVEGEIAGDPFVLEPWQAAPVANIFGWKRRDGTRRYRRVLLYVPRKNGKTPLVGGITDYVFFCDDEAGQQNYIAAADTDQAALMFRWVKGMIVADPDLAQRCQIYGGRAGFGRKAIVNEQDGSYIQVISADAHTKHGQNPHLIIFEELHAQPDRRLYDTLTTGRVSKNRRQPLFICVTTADFLRESICNEEYDYACKVRDGVLDNPAYLPVIYEAGKDDDWTDPKTWAKANPNLGVSVSREAFAAIIEDAKQRPAMENEVKRLHLNLRTEQLNRWIPMDHWDACAHGVDDPIAWRERMLEELSGARCFGGLDLGSISDLTALLLWFEIDGAPDVLIPWFWCPRDGAKKKDHAHRDLYDAWARQGFITYTEGDVTDYDVVRAQINALAQTYGIEDLAVDRLFQGAQLCTQLQGDGLNLVAFGQGFYSMAAPCKEFEERVAAHRISHGANPILHWMASNVAVISDPAGSLKPVKPKRNSPLKIDGIVAAIMALGRLTATGTSTSVYDDPDYGL